jgi:hypothetical protein
MHAAKGCEGHMTVGCVTIDYFFCARFYNEDQARAASPTFFFRRAAHLIAVAVYNLTSSSIVLRSAKSLHARICRLFIIVNGLIG